MIHDYSSNEKLINRPTPRNCHFLNDNNDDELICNVCNRINCTSTHSYDRK